MKPAKHRMAAPLRKWCESAGDSERRTAILRPVANVELGAASREIVERGGEVQSTGLGAITIVASPKTLTAIACLEWVRAIEEPRRLFTTAAPRR
jgi:hypothetical protein